jgi:tetratricopeptide (TPR) repeat protein
VIHKLLHRRVPQFSGLYILGAWGFVQFVDWAVDQYALSPELTNFMVTLLLLLLPSVVLIAWRHGAPGKDRWTKVDALSIGLNLAAAAAVLFLMFGGEELGAATTVKVVEDEAGNVVERTVPKAAFRHSLLLFPFDNDSGDPELDWLGAAMALGVGLDLIQDPFLSLRDLSYPEIRDRLSASGFDRPANVPLPLKREVAESRNLGHLLEGSVRVELDTFVVETRLYETRNARRVAARSYRGTDLLELADEVSLDVRRDLEIPDWHIEEAVDLPAADLLTHSREALRALSESEISQYSNDLVTARSQAERAATLDSTCAVAFLASSAFSLQLGDQQAARASLAEASRFAYRLPERMRLSFQFFDHLLFQSDPEAAIRTARYWAEIYPQDPEAKRLLAQAYWNMGQMGQAIDQFHVLLAMDSADVESARFLAFAFRAQQEYDSALTYFRLLAERAPTNYQTRMDVASTLISLGKYEEARRELEAARIAGPSEPDVLAELARLDIREGQYEAAAERVAQMADLVRSPQERYERAGLEEYLYYHSGQSRRLEDAYRRRLAAATAFLPPIEVVDRIPNSELLIYAVEAGREAYALRQIDSLSAGVDSPWDLDLEEAAVRIHLDKGDLGAARESLTGLRSLREARGASPSRTAYIAYVEGRMAELEDGDCRRALERYDDARELVPLSTLYRGERARCLRALEQWREAEEEIDWLLERYPGWPKIRLEAARLYIARGRNEDAISELDAALGFWSQADPEYHPARQARELLDSLRHRSDAPPSAPR